MSQLLRTKREHLSFIRTSDFMFLTCSKMLFNEAISFYMFCVLIEKPCNEASPHYRC